MVQARPLDLDLLPPQYRPRQLTAMTGLAILIAAALILGLVPSYSALRAEQARTLRVQARLAQAETALAQAQVDRAALDEVEQRIADVQGEIAQLQAEAEAVRQWRTGHSRDFASVVFSLLPGVRLVSVAQQGEGLIIDGEAGSQALALDYARALQATGRFGNVRIVSMVNQDPSGIAPDVSFTILAEP